MRTHILAGSSLLSLLLAVGAANAQTTTSTNPGQPGHSGTPQSWLNDVVVITGERDYAEPNAGSATRTDTRLIEIPQAIQVVNRTLIEEQGFRTVAEALANVSGVIPTNEQEALFTTSLVRGFPAETYVDGLPIYSGPNAVGAQMGAVGVERIEVVKGPTSTLYGGGLGTPLGGLINVVTTRPNEEPSALIAIRAGSFNTINPSIDLNTPLAPGIAARLTAEYQSNESWIDVAEGERVLVQPSVSFDLGPDTNLFLQGHYSRIEQLEYSGIPAEQAMAGEIDRNAFAGAPVGQPRTQIENEMLTAELRHAFNDDLKLTISARYFDNKIPEYGSFVLPGMAPPDPATPTVYPILTLNMMTKTREHTFDANLLAKLDFLGGRHEVLGGVNFDRTNFYSDMAFSGIPVGNINLANPSYTLEFGPLGLPALTQTDHYETTAAYIQDQVSYGSLHLTGSLRYTRLQFSELEQATDRSYHRLSPRIGASFDVMPGVALYAGYGTAFRGAFGFIGNTSPKPETSRNYELGIKLALADAGVSGTVAVFDQTRDNVATPDPANPFLSIQTGRQRAKGVEADVIWEPTPSLSFLANYAYTDAEVTRDNITPIGDTLARVPKHSGRAAVRYRFIGGPAKGLSLGAGVTAFSSREDTLPNSVSVPGYAVIDAQAAYAFGNYGVELSVVNLADEDAFNTYQYFGFPVVMPTQPRSAHVTLKARY